MPTVDMSPPDKAQAIPARYRRDPCCVCGWQLTRPEEAKKPNVGEFKIFCMGCGRLVRCHFWEAD